MNVSRSIRRKNEELYWAFIPRQFNLYRLSLAGELSGLTVPTRRVQTITPYLLTSAQQRWTNQVSTSRYPADVGGEIKYGVTPALTLDLTYNTDFAQVEVDDQRVNLTRFPIFFPEKRPFFLENAGTFSAGTPQAVDLFFTRRIGIASDGTPQQILGGGRLSGRVGGTTIGLLQMVTDASDSTTSGQSFSVARAIRELSSRSRVGAMVVQRLSTRDGADVNRTFAIDGRLGLGQRWTSDLWAARTTTPGLDGDANAASARIAFQTNVWNLNARVAQVGDDFNPEAGFMSRPAGFRTYDASFMRLVRAPQWSWFKQWNPHVSYRAFRGLDDNFFQTGYAHIDVTEIEFANGTRFGPEYNISHEGLQAPFEISPGVVIPEGSYDWGTLGFDYTTDPSENLTATGRFDVGQFWTGRRSGGSGTVTLRRGATFSGSFTADYNDVRLPEGNFIRSLAGGSVELLLYAARVRSDAHAIQQPGRRLLGQPALRLVEHGRHRTLHRVQRRARGHWLAVVGATTATFDVPQVHAAVRHQRLNHDAHRSTEHWRSNRLRTSRQVTTSPSRAITRSGQFAIWRLAERRFTNRRWCDRPHTRRCVTEARQHHHARITRQFDEVDERGGNLLPAGSVQFERQERGGRECRGKGFRRCLDGSRGRSEEPQLQQGFRSVAHRLLDGRIPWRDQQGAGAQFSRGERYGTDRYAEMTDGVGGVSHGFWVGVRS